MVAAPEHQFSNFFQICYLGTLPAATLLCSQPWSKRRNKSATSTPAMSPSIFTSGYSSKVDAGLFYKYRAHIQQRKKLSYCECTKVKALGLMLHSSTALYFHINSECGIRIVESLVIRKRRVIYWLYCSTTEEEEGKEEEEENRTK